MKLIVTNIYIEKYQLIDKMIKFTKLIIYYYLMQNIYRVHTYTAK